MADERTSLSLQARGPKWLPEIIRLTWYLQIINLVFSIHGAPSHGHSCHFPAGRSFPLGIAHMK